MAFPIAPANGQVYVTPDGMRYVYATAAKSWTMSSGGAVSKDNLSATVDPIATDDINLGYGVGSSWRNVTTGTFFECTSNVIGAAIWKISGIRPAHFAGNVPLLTAVPNISTTIPFTTVSTIDITNVAGAMTISTAGVYSISFTAYIYASAIKRTYQAQYIENAVLDPLMGTQSVYRNAANTTYTSNYSFTKIKTLTAGSIITIDHMTDDLAMTIGCDISIIRVG